MERDARSLFGLTALSLSLAAYGDTSDAEHPSTAGMPASATARAPAGGQTFATRCAQPGVVRCIGFDAATDFPTGSAATSDTGYLPDGSGSYAQILRDTSIKASGNSSLRFTIPSNSAANSSGAFWANFSKDLSIQFDGGQEFYVQWRQRFSPEFISTKYSGGGGAKQVIVGTGDQPGKTYGSCTDIELAVNSYYQNGFPIMYNSCSGSTSHPPYDGFYEPFGAYDFKLQNGRAAPFCLYSQKSTSFHPPVGNCFGYVANEWMTFQMRVQVGARVGDEFKNSFVTLWGAREGKASELLIQWGPYHLTAGKSGNQRFGKVWLLPYNTGKSAAQAHPTAYTWYDELVISRSRIADPT